MKRSNESSSTTTTRESTDFWLSAVSWLLSLIWVVGMLASAGLYAMTSAWPFAILCASFLLLVVAENS